MKRMIILIFLLLQLTIPVYALQIEAPPVPENGSQFMPEDTTSFADGLLQVLDKTLRRLHPDLTEAVGVGVRVFTAGLLFSVLKTAPKNGKRAAELAGVTGTAVILLGSSNALVHLAAETVRELSDYGKLLFPVMTAAMAAQGGVTTSAALYAGTTMLDSLLSSLLSGILVPAVYLFLAMAIIFAATGEEMLKRIRDLIRSAVGWCLRTILTVFTTYMSITGVVSGTTDAAALKAAKVTISSVVPVVGGILSDASEAVLVSAGMMKNAAGIYGILAVLAVFLTPFLRIGIHYLVLKVTAALCGILGSGGITGLTEDFSAAMGLLLAMTGSVCLLLLISTVCFMKGVL